MTTMKYLLFICQIRHKFKQTKLKKLYHLLQIHHLCKKKKKKENAEILFTLKLIVANWLANSIDGMSQLFHCIFTDSGIGKYFF